MPTEVHRFLYLLILGVFHASAPDDVPPPAGLPPVPSVQQVEWHRMEMNAFVHFSINTFTDKEWGGGDESPAIFNPSSLDVEQWASVFAEAGFKGVILTVKHHDGFCLWPSRYTEHSVKASPWRRGSVDVVLDLADACRRHGLKFGIYLSPWDRNHADYGRPAYVDYYRSQLKELIESYGPFFEIWFDGANGGSGYYGGAREIRRIDPQSYYDWPATHSVVRSLVPGALMFSDAGPDIRWCGNESGQGGETNWATINTDTLYPGKPNIGEFLNSGMEDGSQWIPAEVNTSIRPGWFYHSSEDSLVKTPAELFEIYLNSVGRGSTLLLNVPPDRKGRIHPNDVKSLFEWKGLRDEAFRVDLARGTTVRVTNVRGSSRDFDASKLVDGDEETFWSTDDDVHTGSITVDLGGSTRVSYIVLKERIQLGQRIRSFSVDVQTDSGWSRSAIGTTVGYKRILRLQATTRAVRVNILSSKAAPVLTGVSVF